MAAKGRVAESFATPPSPKETAAILNDVVFIALPTPLFAALTDSAAKRQQTLAQFLAEAVTVALEKPLPPSLLTEEDGKK